MPYFRKLWRKVAASAPAPLLPRCACAPMGLMSDFHRSSVVMTHVNVQIMGVLHPRISTSYIRLCCPSLMGCIGHSALYSASPRQCTQEVSTTILVCMFQVKM